MSSKIKLSSSGVSPQLQTHISNYLHDISSQMSDSPHFTCLQQISWFLPTFLLRSVPPSVYSISLNDNVIILVFQAKNLQNSLFLPFPSLPPSLFTYHISKSYWFHLQQYIQNLSTSHHLHCSMIVSLYSSYLDYCSRLLIFLLHWPPWFHLCLSTNSSQNRERKVRTLQWLPKALGDPGSTSLLTCSPTIFLSCSLCYNHTGFLAVPQKLQAAPKGLCIGCFFCLKWFPPDIHRYCSFNSFKFCLNVSFSVCPI